MTISLENKTGHKKTIKAEPAVFDWQAIQTVLNWFFIGSLLSIFAIIGSYSLNSSLKKWKEQQKEQAKAIETEHAKMQTRLELIKSLDYAKFLELVNNKFFSNEHTIESEQQIELEEMVLNIQTQLEKLLSENKQFKYNLKNTSPTLVNELPEFSEYSVILETLRKYNLQLYTAQYALESDFLHEGYALNLLNQIKKINASGLLLTQECILKRLNSEINTRDVTRPNLHLSCKLVWFALRLAK